ncbi:MAG TPA: ComF family protein [Thermoanaerobaculia bacterium]|nr:ComF family protein [Thermoanaerobaculia bacterium]
MSGGFANAVSNIGREALRIVLPSWCIACDRELAWRERTASCCADCWASLPKITTATCRSCALPLPGDTHICIECSADPLPLDWCEAWGEYGGALEKLLHALKFSRQDFLDAPLAALLEERMRARGDVAFDAIVPVPMLRARERKRGYNQAALLAFALAPRIGAPCEPSLLGRRKEGATQSTLPKRARAANVRGAFRAMPAAKDRSILIVDDICTTGETLRACAAALRKAGAAKVCAVTVAKAT